MTVAVGVIGLGVMGAEHLRLLQQEAAGATVAAVCDADPGRAAALARGARLHADPAALVDDPAVQAVIVASPDATHAPLVLHCLRRGKPVLCEKPLAPTPAEARAVVEAEVALGRRLVQTGYMRRFDPAYAELKRILQGGAIGPAVLLHNTHRNTAAPDWFSGAMAVTNSFVHELDISRWLLGSEPVSAVVHAAPGGDPLLITLETDRGEVISTEVFMNARYGYHVHAQVVGREGTAEMATPAVALVNRAGGHGHGWPENWVPRFADAYRIQMNAWLRSVETGVAAGASAWDGYVATELAGQIVAAMQTGARTPLSLPQRPALYA